MRFKKSYKENINSLMNNVIKRNNKLVKVYSYEVKKLPSFVNTELIISKLKYKDYFSNCKFDKHSCKLRYYENSEFFLNENNIKEVADILNDLHSTPSHDFKEFDVIKILNFWNNEIKYELTNWETKIVNLVNDYKGKKTLCHNDLHLGNFLNVKDEIKLIDYDFAGVNYSTFDIVSFISEQEMNEKDRKVFLESYYKNKNIQIEELILFEDFHNIFWKSWSKYMYKKTNNKEFLELNKIRNKNLKNRFYAKYTYN